MRSILLLTVALSISVVSTAAGQKSAQADYIIGQIAAARGTAIEIDLGYIHGFRSGQQLAVFRSNNNGWDPLGVVQIERIQSTRSMVRSIKGSPPRKGDIVVIARSNLPVSSSKLREERYVRRRLIARRYGNGYDTRNIAADTRQLAAQHDNAQKWYRQIESGRPSLKLTWGTRKEAYESERVRRLVNQCHLFTEVSRETPNAAKSFSDRWTTVMPMVALKPRKFKRIKLRPKKDEEQAAAASQEDVPEDFANDPIVADLLQRVQVRYREVPLARQEVIAAMLGAAVLDPPASIQAFMKERLPRTQFPDMAQDPDLLDSLDQFFSNLGG